MPLFDARNRLAIYLFFCFLVTFYCFNLTLSFCAIFVLLLLNEIRKCSFPTPRIIHAVIQLGSFVPCLKEAENADKEEENVAEPPPEEQQSHVYIWTRFAAVATFVFGIFYGFLYILLWLILLT